MPGGVFVWRGEGVESRHRVSLAISDGRGRLLAHVGDPDGLVFLRSTAKPFQAAAALAAGALDALRVSDEELAVICASHSGEDVHVRLVSALLGRMGLDRTALRCGAHPPIHSETAERIGGAATALHNNCSGKHAGMLALARHLGAPLGDYLHPDGSTQRRIVETVAAACGVDPNALLRATDGCSAPIVAVPLRAAARAYARLARPVDAPEALGVALARIAAAMADHPHLVAGAGRFDTRLMTVTSGRLLAKAGAEAVQGIANRENGLGLFLKIHDGNARGAAPAVLEASRQAGWIETSTLGEVGDLWRPQLRNHAGLVVGRIEADFVLERAGD